MPGGRSPGKAPGRNRSRDLAPSSSRANRIPATAPSGAGSARYAPGLAAKLFEAANWHCGGDRASRTAFQPVLVTKVMGMAVEDVSNTESIGRSGRRIKRFTWIATDFAEFC